MDDGIWLLSESLILKELHKAAVFIVGISYRNNVAKGWGFWRESAVAATWIGPRHTNFPDGSICAFSPPDGTWQVGDSITTLIDIYSVWALRHLHLETFGTWPGHQVAHHRYERILEFKETELCYCGSGVQYGMCCMNRDISSNHISEAVRFIFAAAGGLRAPPRTICNVALGFTPLPLIVDNLMPYLITPDGNCGAVERLLSGK